MKHGVYVKKYVFIGLLCTDAKYVRCVVVIKMKLMKLTHN